MLASGVEPHTYLLGEPCEVKLGDPYGPKQIYACGEPARFIYYGLIPEIWASSSVEVKQMVKRGHPLHMVMCPDHAMALARDWSWHIKDGKVRIERLDIIVYRSFCSNCLVFTRIQVDLGSPVKPTHFAPRFCPECGHENPIRVLPEADYWEIISEHFENMPVELLRMLYVEWPRNRYKTFADYVKAQVAEYETTGDFEAAKEA
jgi:hypothetical protein